MQVREPVVRPSRRLLHGRSHLTESHRRAPWSQLPPTHSHLGSQTIPPGVQGPLCGRFTPTPSVLVSYCRCTKLPQTYWIKTTQVYYLTRLETGSPDGVSWAEAMVSVGLHFICRLWRRIISSTSPAYRGCSPCSAHGPFCLHSPSLRALLQSSRGLF